MQHEWQDHRRDGGDRGPGGRTFDGGISRRAITLNVDVLPFRSEDFIFYTEQ